MFKFDEIQNWFKVGIINLAIVALYGTLMRYKIAFNFPYLEQKSLLHAHEHFAFNGWISHIIYSGLVVLISSKLVPKQVTKYKYLILLNLICAYGMLVTFTLFGYSISSITFSVLSIIVTIIFSLFFIYDSEHLKGSNAFRPWAITALIMNIISYVGLLFLAYMIFTKNVRHDLYLSAVYYHLHFQYNGWFFFGSMAIATSLLPHSLINLNKYFKIFAITVIPTFFLSILWTKLPMWLYIITVIATIAQLYAWISLLITNFPEIRRQNKNKISSWSNLFLLGAALAMTIKFVLQTVSVIPSLSQLVFGIRSIVIAYLHLILLGVYSLFILGYLFKKGWITYSNFSKTASIAFLVGVFLNELLLGTQGLAAFAYIPIPHINEALFFVALLLFLSATGLVFSRFIKSEPET